MGKKLWLGVNEDSQLGTLLQRISANPVIKTTEVAQTWKQLGRDGSFGPLAHTRASFILDALADATEGRAGIRVSKGTLDLKGVRQSLRSEEPGVRVFEETLNIESAKAVNVVSTGPKAPKSESDDDFTFPGVPPVPEPTPGYIKPDWYDVMAASLEAGKHISLSGPPGVGKSTAPEQWAALAGRPVVSVNGEGSFRKRDMAGTVELRDGSTHFQVADFAAAAVYGWVAILNEVNAAEADALLYINSLLEKPFQVQLHGRSYNVHPDFRLVCTFNPNLHGTKPLPQAFKDRFMPLRVNFPENDLLERILLTKGMPEGAPYAQRLLDFAQTCWKAHASQGILRYQISPRRLFDVVFLMEKLDMSLRDALRAAVLNIIDSPTDFQAMERLIDAVR